MDLSIIIPCFNEVENVPKLKHEFLPVVFKLAQNKRVEVVFVDDGSSDGTAQALKTVFCHLLESNGPISILVKQHVENQGLGAAIRTGFVEASGQILVTTDCDGTYRFNEIPALLSYLAPNIDIVTASPYHPHGAVDGVPGYRLLLSRGSSAIYRLLADRRIHTYTALFRAYRRDVINNVPFESDGFLAGTELLVNGIRMGYRVAEYPTVLYARDFGASKAKIARTVKAHLGFQANTLLPWHPYGTIIRGSDETVFLYTDGQKRPFPSAEIFLSHGYHWQQVVQISDHNLHEVFTGQPMAFRSGTLIRGSGDTVYVIENGRKRAMISSRIFKGLGFQWQHVMSVADSDLAQIHSGPDLDTIDRHPDGTLLKAEEDDCIYLLEKGQRCLIMSVQIFQSWGYRWDQVIEVHPYVLDAYPEGQPIPAQPSFQLDHFITAVEQPELPLTV